MDYVIPIDAMFSELPEMLVAREHAALAYNGNPLRQEHMTKETGTPAGDTAEKDGASAKDTAAADPAGGDIPTLVYWTVGGTTPSDFDQDIAAINEYLEEKIHVKLDLKVAGWGDYEKKMNTIINSGEYFDMMFVNNTNYSRFVKMGAFEDIS